jgi:hypothetical protein
MFRGIFPATLLFTLSCHYTEYTANRVFFRDDPTFMNNNASGMGGGVSNRDKGG